MNERFSRQSFLGPQSDAVLAGARIGIVGLCGGGSHVAQQMAHVGIGKFLIADFDSVDETNLNRMIGSCPEDAKRSEPKTAVIEHMIRKINPDAEIEIVADRWQASERLFRACTVIVGCVDSFGARDELERFCRRYLIPYVDLGMDVHPMDSDGFSIGGQVILSLPDMPCMRCLGFLTEARLAEEQKRYGAVGSKPQVVWPNGILASAAVGQIMQLLLPWHRELRPSIMLEYDGNRQILKESSKVQIVLQSGGCAHFSGFESLGDPFFGHC